jgi:hypothetical protein
MDEKEARALKLNEARQNFEKRLRDVFSNHGSDSFQFEMNVDEKRGGVTEGAADRAEELRGQVLSQVEAFESSPDVSGSGMRVFKITAIDSDGDGEVAVKVQYEYGVKAK